MKFMLTLKCPDKLYDTIKEEVMIEMEREFPEMEKEEREYIISQKIKETYEFCCEKWFRYGEYVDLEINTDAGTCIVKNRS